MLYVHGDIQSYICALLSIVASEIASSEIKITRRFEIAREANKKKRELVALSIQSKNGNGSKFILTFLTLPKPHLSTKRRPKDPEKAKNSSCLFGSVFAVCHFTTSYRNQIKNYVFNQSRKEQSSSHTQSVASRSFAVMNVNEYYPLILAGKLEHNRWRTSHSNSARLMSIILWRYEPSSGTVDISNKITLDCITGRGRLPMKTREIIN